MLMYLTVMYQAEVAFITGTEAGLVSSMMILLEEAHKKGPLSSLLLIWKLMIFIFLCAFSDSF